MWCQIMKKPLINSFGDAPSPGPSRRWRRKQEYSNKTPLPWERTVSFKAGCFMDKTKPGFGGKQSRREQGQVRSQILTFLKESETLLAIVRALKTFDITNLRENARRALETIEET